MGRRLFRSGPCLERKSAIAVVPGAVEPCEVAVLVAVSDPIILVKAKVPIRSWVYSEGEGLGDLLIGILLNWSNRQNRACLDIERHGFQVHISYHVLAALYFGLRPEVPPLSLWQ